MEPLRRLIRGLVVASAAILAVLAAGTPALAAPTPTPTASATDGAGNTGTFDGTTPGDLGNDGTTTGKSDGASNPTLQLSKNQAAPGETITVAGDGYTQCTKPDTQETWVRLLGDGNQIADVTGSGGSFSTQVTVPADAPAGDHTVSAECFDASSGETTSGVLASSDLVVTAAVGGSPPAQSGGSNSVPGGGSVPGDSSPGQSSTGNGSPIALVSGVGGGLIVAILLLLWARVSHTGKRHRDVRWVKEHLRAVAESSLGPPSAAIRPRPGAKSVSLGLEPHADHFGNHKIKEVAR